jgi:hypothetical protein
MLRQYSHCFSTLHDEAEPVGRFGGTHYSILRAVLWDKAEPQWHDFAVIWDCDHDTRIIWVIEQLYVQRLLRDVFAIGERKGSVTILTTSTRPAAKLVALVDEGWQHPTGDYFNGHLEHVDDATGLLINDVASRVQAYVKGIDALWCLGSRTLTDPHGQAYV